MTTIPPNQSKNPFIDPPNSNNPFLRRASPVTVQTPAPSDNAYTAPPMPQHLPTLTPLPDSPVNSPSGAHETRNSSPASEPEVLPELPSHNPTPPALPPRRPTLAQEATIGNMSEDEALAAAIEASLRESYAPPAGPPPGRTPQAAQPASAPTPANLGNEVATQEHIPPHVTAPGVALKDHGMPVDPMVLLQMSCHTGAVCFLKDLSLSNQAILGSEEGYAGIVVAMGSSSTSFSKRDAQRVTEWGESYEIHLRRTVRIGLQLVGASLDLANIRNRSSLVHE
ncbi:hypothetical protein FRB99_006524 [Tulasnella sp. 403]|nr:hypothetical protein FRB99_006524 [Tulasnella sp. 403]